MSPYSVIPPQYGGSTRIYNIYKEISKYYQVVHFAQQVTKNNLAFTTSPLIQEITPTYAEYSCRNPLNIFLYGVISYYLKYPFTLHSEVLNFSAPRWLYYHLKKADIINVEHPWQFPWIYNQLKQKKPILLTAQNVEAVLFPPEKFSKLPSPAAKQLSKDIARRENFAVQHATRVLTMSSQDAGQLVNRYHISPDKCVVIPNGVDCKVFYPVEISQRKMRKEEIGLRDKTVVLFAGSTHAPNREAVDKIIHWAKIWPDNTVHFLIVGSIGRLFSDINLPNITFTGLVESISKYFEAADIAINPMISGSGTNLKQIEYMAMGLASLTTDIGARGIGIENEKHAFISDIEDFPYKLQWIIDHPEICSMIGKNARLFAKKNYDWSVIGKKIIEVYQSLGI